MAEVGAIHLREAPEAVARDGRFGYVTRSSAAKEYRVVLSDHYGVDYEATRKLRGGTRKKGR